MRESEMSGGALRRRLLLVVAAAMLPVALVSGAALLALRQDQLAQAERASIELSRALTTAVDAELDRSVSVLQVLAEAPALDRGELARFDGVMRRVLAANPDWYSLILADRAARPLLNSRVPRGAKLPAIVERESFSRAVETGKPVVGNLAEGASGGLYVPVRVPVLRGDEVRYVLTAVLKPDGIRDVVNRQRVPSNWVVSVFDAKRARVARSRQHAENLGTQPAPSLSALLDRGGEEGWGRTVALEGDVVYAGYSRSPETGWIVAIGIPEAVIEAGAGRSAAAFGAGILLSIALGLIAAVALGRGITRPMA